MPEYSIPNYDPHPNDFIATRHDVGLCEIQGKRPNQQDALAICPEDLTSFTDISDANKVHVLTQTVADIQAHQANLTSGGATLCTALTWQDPISNKINVWTVNLGDSSAYLVILNAQKQYVDSTRLNTLHNPDPDLNQAEYERVKKISPPRPTTNCWRLQSGLAVSRSLGDKAHEAYGLSHNPGVIKGGANLEESDSAYLILACDGLYTLTTTDIGHRIAIQAQKEASAEAMAFDLVSKAYRLGSTDNISAAVIEIDTTARSALVADGHGYGGEVVASYAAQYFYSTLKKCIEGVLLTEKKMAPNERVQASAEFFKKQKCDEQLSIIEQALVSLSPEELKNLVIPKINALIEKTLLQGREVVEFLVLEDVIKLLTELFTINTLAESLLKDFEQARHNFNEQFSPAIKADLTSIYAYVNLSDHDKNIVISECLGNIQLKLNSKMTRFLNIAMQLDRKISLINDHINQQPTQSSWWSIWSTKNTAAKNRLLEETKCLVFNYLEVPVTATPTNYTAKNTELDQSLGKYEANLIKNNSKTHLKNYQAFKPTLSAASAELFTDEETEAFKARMHHELGYQYPAASTSNRSSIESSSGSHNSFHSV